MPRRPLLALLLAASVLACAPGASSTPPSAAPASARAATMDGPMAGAPVPESAAFKWSDFSADTFVRAKKEKRIVLLDGAAEWCHFCHVMEEKTYADPRVRAILEKSFVATKVDIDVRPDIEERYVDYGWPATVLFSPEGEELGKYRGFIPPDEFLTILETVVAGGASLAKQAPPLPKVPDVPLELPAVEVVQRNTLIELEDYWDKKEGGWGREPKVPLYWNTLFALSRARENAVLKEHALTILDKQRRLIDPVWGGMYQYSVAPDWDHPHFEKLMTWNGGALASYATAYALTKDKQHKRSAQDIRRFLEAFMISPEGGFYGTQDADLNAHPASLPFSPTSPRGKGAFMKGEDYYRLGDKERRALGVPRIDPNEYADDNGLAIYAYATYAIATGEVTASAIAKRAAERILATHRTANGGLAHLPDPTATTLHLSDVASMGFGLVHLYSATKETRWRDEAAKLAAVMEKELYDRVDGRFRGQTIDPNAVGVFKIVRIPFDDGVLAVRFLIALDQAEATARHRDTIEHGFRALSTPENIKDRGKFLGDWLALADELVAHRALRPPHP